MSYVLALLFALSFLPQGLFYRHEFLPAVALLGAWLLWRAWRSRARVPRSLYGGPALLLIGYLLSLLDALRPADTWMAVAQLAVLFGLMLAAAEEKDPRTVLRGIVAAAFVGALYALLVRGGFWHDPAAYTPPFLTGSIQYHNAFGAAMALGLLVGLALAVDESRTAPYGPREGGSVTSKGRLDKLITKAHACRSQPMRHHPALRVAVSWPSAGADW